MIRRTLAALVLTMSIASPAAGCDPYWDNCWWWRVEPASYVEETTWWHEPAWAPPSPPEPSPEPVWQPASEPALVIPRGVYLVTEVYVADVVSIAGPLTTYSTATVAETPGSYARVIDTVGTGTVSAYDGSAFNGRTALDDGRAVAGTYYENFVLSNGEFVPVSIVFFQDDSALAAEAPPAPSPAPEQTPAPTPAPIAVVQPTPVPAVAPAPPVAIIRPGVSASPVGEVRSAIEVLRGRAIPVWIRAAADGVPHPVASWRIRSGEHIALGPSSGGADDAFSVRWDVVTPPGVAWILGVDVTIDIGGVPQTSFGEIAVVVRSPALVR